MPEDAQRILELAVEYKGFTTSITDKLDVEIANLLGGRTHSSEIACFSEQVNLYLTITVNLADVAKVLALPVGAAIVCKFIKAGKDLHEGIQGWKGLYELAALKQPRKLQAIRERAEALAGETVTLSIGVNLPVKNSAHLPHLRVVGPQTPDDELALLGCMASALETAIDSLEANGAIFAHDLHVRFASESFAIKWHNHHPSTDFVAVFDYDGCQIGQWVERQMSDEEKQRLFLKWWEDGAQPHEEHLF